MVKVKMKTMRVRKKAIIRLSLTGVMRILRRIRMRNIVIQIPKLSWRPITGTLPKGVVTQKTDDTMMIVMSNTCPMIMTEKATIMTTSDLIIITMMCSAEGITTPILRLTKSDSSKITGRARVLPISRAAVSENSVKKSWMIPMKLWLPT